MHKKENVIWKGKKDDDRVLVLVHGRGSNGKDLMSLTSYLPLEKFSIIAPQATNNTWYPLSFLANPKDNEPYLSSAIQLLKDVVSDAVKRGVPEKNIYLLGFSQGACLALEFAARNAKRYGGVIAFTGGLIGDKIYKEHYHGDFAGTPVFIGTSDTDPHVPMERIHGTNRQLFTMNAHVELKIYPGMGHTINEDEIKEAGKILRGS